MPNFQQIREWDGTLDVVEVKHVPFSKLAEGEEMVTLTYHDGVTHKVTEAYYKSIHVKECCCICGDSRDPEPEWEGQWPSCPGCGTI